jgi:hypothetical protein
MKGKRLGWLGCLLASLLVAAPAWAAERDLSEPAGEEPKQPPETPPAPEKPAGEKKVPWWGGRFALYLQASFGGSSFDDIDPSLTTREASFISRSTFSLDDNDYGRLEIGWKFPFERGRALVSWTAHKENSFSFASAGLRNVTRQIGTPNIALLNGLVPYWTLSLSGGQLTSSRTGFFWNSLTDDKPHGTDPPNGQPDLDEVRPGAWTDLNGNGIPEQDEVVFGGKELDIRRDAPANLSNRLQSLDVLYEREFGGRRVNGRWRGGLRHFRYEGNVPAAAWLTVGGGASGQGWTDGAFAPLISLRQETTGTGPTGSVQVQAHFLRRRLTLYAQGNAAFLVSNLDVDSGPVAAFLFDSTSGALVPVPGRIRSSSGKSTWNVGAELGAQVNLRSGLMIEAAFSRTGYLDALLLPSAISVPSNFFQDIAAVFSTRDLRSSAWRVGFGYQF